MDEQVNDRDPYEGAKTSKFRLKSNSSSKRKRHRRDHDGEDSQTYDSHRHYRSEGKNEQRNSSRKRRRETSSRTARDYKFPRNGEYDNPDGRHRESLYDGLDSERVVSPDAPRLDSDEAFRESLFDALADDEGAAYWEGVYGQPIHTYSDTKKGPDGKLERMSEEEYAEYVRTKMWEKSHQHILEEREARDRDRKRRKECRQQREEETARQEEERARIRHQVQESLERGEERKKIKLVEAAWSMYTKKWDELKLMKNPGYDTDGDVRDVIPWPVVSGRWKNVSKDEIEHFFENSSAWNHDPTALLKAERVRWHPDKIQQRFGQHIDSETMKSVTAVFQVIDKLWNEQRK